MSTIRRALAIAALTVAATVGIAGVASAEPTAPAKDNPGQGYVHSNPAANGQGKGRQAPAPIATTTTYPFHWDGTAGVITDAQGAWSGDAAVFWPTPGDVLDPASVAVIRVDASDGAVLTVTGTKPSDDPAYAYTGWSGGGLIAAVSITGARPYSTVEFTFTATATHTVA